MEIIRGIKKLNLVNEGQLDLFFLGVGAASSIVHNQCNFLLVCGDTHLLVDLGDSGVKALHQVAGLTCHDIECILPTHSHGDHVHGIETWALLNRYVGQRFMKKPKVKMIVTEEYQRILWDYTLRGGLEPNEENEGRPLTFRDYFDVVRPEWLAHQPREIFRVRYGNLGLELFRTVHVPEQSTEWGSAFVSYGLLVNGRVFISGDTKYDPDLISLYKSRGIETYFQDVQFFKGGVHCSLEEARLFPAEVQKDMLLMHYPDNWKDQDITGFAGWAEQGVVYRWA